MNSLVTLALAIFDIGAVEFRPRRLKAHERDSNIPLSPIYLNLRTPDNPKPGPLTPEILWEIGRHQVEVVSAMNLRYDTIAGIPHAGDPFAAAFRNALPWVVEDAGVPLLRLEKSEEGGKRRITRIIEGACEPGGTVLLFDDLVTQADTKLEAIAACRDAGLHVTDLVVLIDREQGGKEELLRHGVRLIAIFRLSSLLDRYVEHGRITPEKRDEVLAYIAANRAPSVA